MNNQSKWQVYLEGKTSAVSSEQFSGFSGFDGFDASTTGVGYLSNVTCEKDNLVLENQL